MYNLNKWNGILAIFKKILRAPKSTIDTSEILVAKNSALEKRSIGKFKNPNKTLLRIFEGVHKFPYLNVFVHGSWADDTRTPFSDLDDLIIIDSAFIENNKEKRKLDIWLNKVDMRFCRLDVLQHHGHWFITKNDLFNYDGSHIPLGVLRDSIMIQGNGQVQYFLNSQATKLGLKRNIEHTLSNIERLSELYFSKRINAYDLKCLVGSFLLLPAYLFQYSDGIDISKREAILSSHKIYTKKAYSVIEKSSKIRMEWGRVMKIKDIFFLKILSKVFTNPHLFRKFVAKFSPKVGEIFSEKWTKEEIDNFIKESKIYAGL